AVRGLRRPAGRDAALVSGLGRRGRDPPRGVRLPRGHDRPVRAERARATGRRDPRLESLVQDDRDQAEEHERGPEELPCEARSPRTSRGLALLFLRILESLEQRLDALVRGVGLLPGHRRALSLGCRRAGHHRRAIPLPYTLESASDRPPWTSRDFL